MKPLCLAGLLPLLATAHAGILFEDTFGRTDSRNIQESLAGITDNTGSSLAAGAVYSQPFLDPNNAAPTFGVQDAVATNGGGAQVASNQLQLSTGVGTSNAFINHNFINPGILTDGRLSVSLDVMSFAGTDNGSGGGFAIGMSQAEAASAGDSFNGASRMTGGFGTAIGAAVPAQSLADFWVLLRGNNTLVWGGDTGVVAGVTALPAKTGSLRVDFYATSFDAGSIVNYQVFLNSVLRGSGSFTWSGTDENYIGLDTRDGTGVTLDNLRIETQNIALPPSVAGFEVTRINDGVLDTRLHWSVAEGTPFAPVTITISDGTTDIHSTNELKGFIDLPSAGATSYTLTAVNASGQDEATRTPPAADDAFAAAVRADVPVAWFRFNEAAGSKLIADSAENWFPHQGEVIGNVITGQDGPRDGTANFSGDGASILSDFIFNPSLPANGHTIEAIVRRYPGSNPNAAIVSQTDGTGGVGRSHLAVDSDGTVQTFLAGGAEQRKDADVKLPTYTWAHLVMVVDRTTPEIRYYLDGTLIGSSADGMNPDGSTFDPNFAIESASGAWRIGTQKSAAQNFWLGDMDEVAIYEDTLSTARITAHADAWRSTASGLLGFSSSSETIAGGGSTTLTVKTGSDATSVSIDNGIGTVTPVNGVVTLPVSPSVTTTYTVTVEGPSGTQTLTVTITVEAPASPPVITSGSITGGDFRITFTGTPDTTYNVRGSLDLQSFALDHGTATTDGSGAGEALVPIVPGEGVHFYRIEETP